MPFLEHFGLEDYPFGLTPNGKLFYPADTALATLAALEFAVMRGDGMLKVVGEVGTGKTVLCRRLLDKLKEHPVNTAYFSAPAAQDVSKLPAAVAREFGVKVAAASGGERELRDFLIKQHAKGRRNLLIVDEAQALGVGGLEATRLLSNLETDTAKLMQIVLFGQPELDGLLARHELRQLSQRFSYSFATRCLARDATADYVRFRMDRCSRADARREIFSASALAGIAKSSRGVPRVVNLLADKALMAAYAEGSATVAPRHVKIAVRETSLPSARRLFFFFFGRILGKERVE